MLPTEGEWVTVTEAADRLGLRRSTVQALIARKRIRPEKVRRVHARMNVIAADEVERYRQENLGQGAWKTRKKQPADAPTEE